MKKLKLTVEQVKWEKRHSEDDQSDDDLSDAPFAFISSQSTIDSDSQRFLDSEDFLESKEEETYYSKEMVKKMLETRTLQAFLIAFFSFQQFIQKNIGGKLNNKLKTK